MSETPGSRYRIYVVLGLFVLITCAQVVCAGDNISVLNNHTVNVSYLSQQTSANSFNQTLIQDKDAKEKISAIAAVLSYKENMTFWQKKLPTQILEIIDPNAPLSGMTLNEIRTQLILEENLMPADEVFTKLGVCQPTGDLVKVTINVNSSVSTQMVNPYVIYLIGKRSNLVDAWVDINTIEKIASLDEVKWIDLIGPSIHQGNNLSVLPSTKLRNTQPVLSPADTHEIPSTTLTSLPVAPSKTNTPASALSFIGILTVPACFGLIIVIYRRQETRK